MVSSSAGYPTMFTGTCSYAAGACPILIEFNRKGPLQLCYIIIFMSKT